MIDGSQNLKIGIIGDTPEAREEQIEFVRIQFSDLEVKANMFN